MGTDVCIDMHMDMGMNVCTDGDGADKAAGCAVVYDASKPALFTELSEVNTTCMAPLAAETAAGRALPLAAIRSLTDDDVPS